jgi:Tol biopolymer transport system component
MFHMRGSKGGTYILSEGSFGKFNLKTAEMKNGAVYPRWHPSGRYISFSSNSIIQRFHASDNKKVEVSDLESSLLLYDVSRNEITDIPLSGKGIFMDTYPEWSPDGKNLYFCRAPQVSGEYDYRQIRYDLWRVPFDEAGSSFGTAEQVFSASGLGKSAAFPRISPDGRFLVVTLADYGCFPTAAG